ncbi:hypothetical protein HBJ58_16960 [Halomonas desiderata]|uniref:competence protein CoiA family protein n=1 Tax=Billgrantia desiderata TaxID=52021 RepID=UPI00174C1883|nr:hypothetical protein [Halomonas desiderata]
MTANADKLKVPYGLRGNELLHISEIKTAERGLGCKCVCPSCGGDLRANLGDKKRHHFSHNAHNSCDSAAETGLHLKAKELIAAAKRLRLPPLTISVGPVHSKQAWDQGLCGTDTLVKEGTFAEFDSVLVEQARERIRPDVIGILRDTELFIEIRVTHEVDDVKREEIRRQEVSTVEIDLSTLNRMASPDEIARALADPQRAHWIFHRREAARREALEQSIEPARLRVREAELAAREVEGRKQQAKEAFKQRLSAVYRVLKQRLMAGVAINLPRTKPDPEFPFLQLPLDIGEYLRFTQGPEEWMLWATWKNPTGTTERFIIAWDLRDPTRREPFHLRRLFGKEAPFCILDISSLLQGKQSEWPDNRLDAFLAGNRSHQDRWYREPEWIGAERYRLQQPERERLARENAAANEKAREEEQAALEAIWQARKEQEEKQQNKEKEERRQTLIRQRDSLLQREVSSLRTIAQRGQAHQTAIEQRMQAIQASRSDLVTPVPARWHGVKEISALYPPLESVEAGWIHGRWSALAKPYPFEWIFAIHPDYLKLAVLDDIFSKGVLKVMQEESEEERVSILVEFLNRRLDQTRQPGSGTNGYCSLALRTKPWRQQLWCCARQLRHGLEMTFEDGALQGSAVTEEVERELASLFKLISCLAGTSCRAVTAQLLDGGEALDLARWFCIALAEDLLALEPSATGGRGVAGLSQVIQP